MPADTENQQDKDLQFIVYLIARLQFSAENSAAHELATFLFQLEYCLKNSNKKQYDQPEMQLFLHDLYQVLRTLMHDNRIKTNFKPKNQAIGRSLIVHKNLAFNDQSYLENIILSSGILTPKEVHKFYQLKMKHMTGIKTYQFEQNDSNQLDKLKSQKEKPKFSIIDRPNAPSKSHRPKKTSGRRELDIYLGKLKKYLNKTAQRNKKLIHFIAAVDSAEIKTKNLKQLTDIITLLSRINLRQIERPEVRQKSKKPAMASLLLELKITKKSLTILLSNDGHGRQNSNDPVIEKAKSLLKTLNAKIVVRSTQGKPTEYEVKLPL